MTTTPASPRHHVDGDVDVAPCGSGIRTRLVRGVRHGLGDFPLQTREIDIEASLQEVRAMSIAQVRFRVDGRSERAQEREFARISVFLAGYLQCCCPPPQVINHRLGLSLNLGESFVHVAALVMCPKGRNRNVDRRADRRDLNLYHGLPELLDAARAHRAAIAYENSRLA